MSGRPVPVAVLVLLGLLLAGPAGLGALGGCTTTGGDDGPGRGSGETAPAPAATRLEAQRRDVRAAARTILREAERRLGGRTALSTGAWRGCESAGIEEYRNFRYLGQARVDVPVGTVGAVGPGLAALRTILEAAGFSTGKARPAPGGGRSSLAGTHGEVTAVLTHSGGLVGLDVYGPCVDVAPQDRDAWLRRQEPTPDLLRR